MRDPIAQIDDLRIVERLNNAQIPCGMLRSLVHQLALAEQSDELAEAEILHTLAPLADPPLDFENHLPVFVG
jgi:hypothetical protein